MNEGNKRCSRSYLSVSSLKRRKGKESCKTWWIFHISFRLNDNNHRKWFYLFSIYFFSPTLQHYIIFAEFFSLCRHINREKKKLHVYRMLRLWMQPKILQSSIREGQRHNQQKIKQITRCISCTGELLTSSSAEVNNLPINGIRHISQLLSESTNEVIFTFSVVDTDIWWITHSPIQLDAYNS